jgi:hypothetical protein
VVGAIGDQAAIGNLEFAMELNEAFGLAAILGAESSAAKDENHGMRSLEFGEFAVLRGVVRKFIVGEGRPGNDVGSHGKILRQLDARRRIASQKIRRWKDLYENSGRDLERLIRLRKNSIIRHSEHGREILHSADSVKNDGTFFRKL